MGRAAAALEARLHPDPADGRSVTEPVGSPLVRLTGVAKAYGPIVAVHPLDLAIHAGDFLAILGPSGCGKTTLLNMIAGFVMPDAGAIEIAGSDVTRLGPERRPTNMVFQGYGLFPHMNVVQNIAYGPRLRRMPREEIDRQVGDVIRLVDLVGLENRAVTELSGGQAQRVALARALIMRPKVLLLDEPLAALDLQLRKAMQEELRRIHRSIGGTFVFVTHDQEEAMRLANRIAVMQAGRLIQEGTAQEVYARPRTRFVSTFIGAANALGGRRLGGRVTLDVGPSFAAPGPDGPVVAVVRPEAMTVSATADRLPAGATLFIAGRVADAVFLGSHVDYRIAVGDQIVAVEVSHAPRQDLAIGAEVIVGWAPDAQTLLADE
jgi:ABC-type Fe3+/spermidine/putrescine transport system ATPase subunit